MSAPIFGFDVKCYNLAAAFIADTGPYSSDSTEPREAITNELAQVIQDAIEDFLREKGL